MKVYFLQFRERDQLAKIFQTWLQPQSSSATLMPKAWDHRVRQHLGIRYNCKSGSFDWDVTMKLHEKGVRVKLVCVCAFLIFDFFFASLVPAVCRVVLSTSASMCGGGRGGWPLKSGRAPTK